MKKFIRNKIILSVLSFFFVMSVMAQSTTDTTNQEQKKTINKEKTEKNQDQIKKGWNVGPLPVISFDSDLGFQYGALVDFYNYGNGKDYPNYRQSLYMEVSQFTKKSGIYRINYDSKDLIKGYRVYIDLSYLPDQAYGFYGYNGYNSVYNSAWVTTGDASYKTRMFYRYQRKFFRTKIDFMGYFNNKKLHWIVGVGLYDIKVAPVDLSILNKGKSGSDILPDSTGLYERYVQSGIIPKSEENGGIFTVLKGALEYDSRDNEGNPNKGIWTELVLAYAPKALSNMDNGFLKLSITHRQYFTLVPSRLTFAYRLGAQINLAGETPFYAMPLLFYARSTSAYDEGLGGSSNLRGVMRNRVIGDGVAYGNFEFRWKFVKFHFIKQNFYLALSAFMDSGTVIQNEPITSAAAEALGANYFKNDGTGSDGLHSTLGMGFHFVMNQNFIIAVDHGQALNPQDGTSGTYVGLNFLF